MTAVRPQRISSFLNRFLAMWDPDAKFRKGAATTVTSLVEPTSADCFMSQENHLSKLVSRGAITHVSAFDQMEHPV